MKPHRRWSAGFPPALHRRGIEDPSFMKHSLPIFALTGLALGVASGVALDAALVRADAPKAAPDSRYKVVEPPANYPEDLREALKKVAVTPPPEGATPDKVRVKMETSRGPITLELDGKAAPLHVKSFAYLARQGFYNGTRLHRHADLLGNGQGWIIQGGDPFTKAPELKQYFGVGGPGYQIPRERNTLTHKKLVIAMARSSDPNSAGSQFYITQNPVSFLDQGAGYTVFGAVVDGADNALKLTKDDELTSVTVEEPAAAPAPDAPK
jgi:peptidyl-prolyl cis-trans isomerase B (cyclophilin B)